MTNPSLSRRQFTQMFAAAAAFACTPSAFAQVRTGPTMLLGRSDAFCGYDVLRARYAAGRRPSTDMAGNALSWLITKQDVYARRALEEMRRTAPPAAGSRGWLPIAGWSLAFDWLHDHPAFEPALKDRVAKQLLDAAITMAATPDLKHPEQASFHNYTTRFLGLTAFAAYGAARHRPGDPAIADLQKKTARAFANILEISDMIVPEGSYHESMDYMRIAYVPVALLAELQRTTTGVDPALRHSMYENFANTYLYKLMPDGTPSREGDNEYPVLDDRDTTALGYAVHRFKNPYAAWLLRESGFTVDKWALPVLEFLWNDPNVTPRDPQHTVPGELASSRYFPGVDQVVFRDRWGKDATWIEFDCGPYLAKHQHLDRGHFSIYHRGYLAIDSGADYTESESPHYINYYRRTIAHNTMLIYDPSEHFFWSENLLQAANDGGQRMDSSRFWNTLRGREDWEHTRDLWDLGKMRIVDSGEAAEGQAYHYALGDATRAYSPHKLKSFTRQLLYFPESNVLLVFDHVVSTDPGFRKTWLLHGVNMPEIDGAGVKSAHGEEAFAGAKTFQVQEGGGEMTVHTLLPQQHVTSRRGGPGYEFWTPGDARGGAWGTGRNWPLERAEGGPLPTDPEELAMWKTFWGDETKAIERSNRRNVVPGAWRIEVTPQQPQTEDYFLHHFEIGDRGATGKQTVELLMGTNVAGAAYTGDGGAAAALFSTQGAALDFAEATMPSFATRTLWVAGLIAERHYSLEMAGSNLATEDAVAPGIPIRSLQARANAHGILQVSEAIPAGCRVRLQVL